MDALGICACGWLRVNTYAHSKDGVQTLVSLMRMCGQTCPILDRRGSCNTIRGVSGNTIGEGDFLVQVGGLVLRFYWMLLYDSRKLRDEGVFFAGRPSVDENVQCYLISSVDIFESIPRQQKCVNPPNLDEKLSFATLHPRYRKTLTLRGPVRLYMVSDL